MKHYFSSLQAVLFASLVLASCNSKEIASPDDEPSDSGIPFEVSTVITKTTNDDSQTKWAEGDAINLFHAEAGATTYTSDGKFTVDEGLNGVFSGTLGKALVEGKNYDWYAFYPYTSQISTPANTSAGWVTVGGTSQTQTDNDSRAHLAGTNCPLYGVVKEVASSDMPAFAMNQLTSVVAVNVTNTLSEALTVSSVSFTSTEDIVGTYYINITGDAPVYKSSGGSYVSKTATLTVENGTAIAQGETAKFYIAIKPHTVTSGSTLTVSVNDVEKTLTLTSDVTFTAGHIKTVKYSYDYDVDYSGTYLILDKDKTKVCPAYTFGKNNIPAVTYSESNVQDSWAMTIEKVAGTNFYTIKDANDLYLSAVSSSDNYLKGLSPANESNSYWSINPNSDGTYSIVATKSSNRNVLQYNSQNSLFSCYQKASQTAVTLVEFSALPRMAAPSDVEAEVQDLNSIYVMWGSVDGAKDYTVSCGNMSATVEGDEYTFTGLAYSTEYEISVVANPTDADSYRPSLPATKTVITGANPSSVVTYQHIFTTKPSVGDSVAMSSVYWSIAATNLGSYNSNNYAGVQFGTSDKSGSISLTSSSDWAYSGKSTIKEVRIWLNAGSGTPTATVTIGGKNATSDGTVVKRNTSAKSYKDATMVMFTPASDGNTGVVVIKVATASKAAYICAMEIDCE